MVVVELYNNIYKLLANSSEIRGHLGLGTKVCQLTDEQKEGMTPKEIAEHNKALGRDNLITAKKIQKRGKPVEVVDNVPIITFYAPPGGVEEGNHLVYVTNIVFDIYTKDDVTLAHNISKSVMDIFDDRLIPMKGVSNFTTRFKSAHESSVDLENTYCFTTVIEFSVEIGNRR